MFCECSAQRVRRTILESPPYDGIVLTLKLRVAVLEVYPDVAIEMRVVDIGVLDAILPHTFEHRNVGLVKGEPGGSGGELPRDSNVLHCADFESVFF